MITREHLQSFFGATSIAGIPAPPPIQPIILPKTAPGQNGNGALIAILVIGGLIAAGIIIYNINKNKKEKEKKNGSKFKK